MVAHFEAKAPKGIVMKRHYAYWGVWVLLLWTCPSFAQSITIRVINSNDGKPLQKEEVLVNLMYGKGESTPAKYDPTVHLETDDAGEARLNLPEPAPAHLWVAVHLTSKHWHCACQDLVATYELIQKGITVRGSSKVKPTTGSANAAPGEIVFRARPLSFLERLLYPLVKG